MPDPWDDWDTRVRSCGREQRVAQDLSDAELLNLLSSERAADRDIEKHILKDEALARMQRSRSTPPVESPPRDAPGGPVNQEGAWHTP